MSLQIIKAGLLDTLQDAGRMGMAHMGINTNGPMDAHAQALANALVGNPWSETVLESHFPAPVLHCKAPCVMALAGADFGAQINERYIPPYRTLFLPEGTTIHFRKKIQGQRLYVAVRGGFAVAPVWGSTATNLQAAFGGWKGRALKSGDELPFRHAYSTPPQTVEISRFWIKNILAAPSHIHAMPGPEWSMLSGEYQQALFRQFFVLQPKSNRMALRLFAENMPAVSGHSMVSAPVTMGTVQCLPSGELLSLMADHQTVGGYMRVLQIAKADLGRLAQMEMGSPFQFRRVSMEEAIGLYAAQQKDLQSISSALQMYFSGRY
jgi:antagonist of KipI